MSNSFSVNLKWQASIPPRGASSRHHAKQKKSFNSPLGEPNGIDSNLLKLPVRRPPPRTEILRSLQYSRQQRRLYDHIHTSTMLKYHSDSSKGRRTPVSCRIHSPKATRQRGITPPRDTPTSLRTTFAATWKKKKPADAPRSSRRGAKRGEKKKRKTAAELTSVDPFCVAAGGRPRTGCGGGEEFMHQHDCATPESAASAANRRQYGDLHGNKTAAAFRKQKPIVAGQDWLHMKRSTAVPSKFVRRK